MKHKVVYNTGYGGFGLSQVALDFLAFLGLVPKAEYFNSHGSPTGDYYDVINSIPRHNEALVFLVEHLGKEVNGPVSNLGIIELDGNIYRIESHDGAEIVIEPQDIQWTTIK